MLDTIRNLIRKSEIVVLARIAEGEEASPVGEEHLQFKTEIVHVAKGEWSRSELLPILIRRMGKETPVLLSGKLYLFFLRAHQEHQGWALTNLSRPVEVSEETRLRFARHLDEYVEVSGPAPGGDRMKHLIFRMLDSGIPLFQRDASSEALHVDSWDQDQLDMLIDDLRGEEGCPPLSGLARENITTVVVSRGAPEQVVSLARDEMLASNTDAVYYGLDERKEAGVERILWQLLEDKDRVVRIRSIRVAGLLRRTEILDKVQKRYNQEFPKDEVILRAIQDAYALARRD